jgi:hypothetical protein
VADEFAALVVDFEGGGDGDVEVDTRSEAADAAVGVAVEGAEEDVGTACRRGVGPWCNLRRGC